MEDGEVPRTFVAHVRVRLTCAMRPRTNDDSASTSKEDVETPLEGRTTDARENEKIFKHEQPGPKPEPVLDETDFQPRMVVPKIGESR